MENEALLWTNEREGASKRKLYMSKLASSNLNVDFDLQTNQHFEKLFEETCDRRQQSLTHTHTCSRNGTIIYPSAHETTYRNLFGQIALFYLVIRFNHVSSLSLSCSSSSSTSSATAAAEMKYSFNV